MGLLGFSSADEPMQDSSSDSPVLHTRGFCSSRSNRRMQMCQTLQVCSSQAAAAMCVQG
jgi:hypothetical protein